MKIIEIRLGKLSIPLKKTFKTALRSTDTVPSNIINFITDTGDVGWGEAPPTAAITGETDGSIISAITERISAVVLGRDISEIHDILNDVEKSIVRNSSAKAAVDIALHDLLGKFCKMPLWKLWGGSERKFSTDYTISLNAPEEMAKDALEAVNDGYDALKIKVGINFQLDMQRINAVREAVGSEVLLRVDANQGWTPKEAVRVISFMEDKGLNIELVEQPVKYHDISGLKYVTDNVNTLILADEALYSPQDAMLILSMRAADLLNIKLMKCGGLKNALSICAMAESSGVECMIGCMMESKISVTAAANLAMARKIITKYDLDPPVLCSSDPVKGGAIYDGHVISLGNEPGLGIENVEGVNWHSSIKI